MSPQDRSHFDTNGKFEHPQDYPQFHYSLKLTELRKAVTLMV